MSFPGLSSMPEHTGKAAVPQVMGLLGPVASRFCRAPGICVPPVCKRPLFSDGLCGRAPLRISAGHGGNVCSSRGYLSQPFMRCMVLVVE